MAIISLGKIRRVIIFPLLMMCNSIFNTVMLELCAKEFQTVYNKINNNEPIKDLAINDFKTYHNFCAIFIMFIGESLMIVLYFIQRCYTLEGKRSTMEIIPGNITKKAKALLLIIFVLLCDFTSSYSSIFIITSKVLDFFSMILKGIALLIATALTIGILHYKYYRHHWFGLSIICIGLIIFTIHNLFLNWNQLTIEIGNTEGNSPSSILLNIVLSYLWVSFQEVLEKYLMEKMMISPFIVCGLQGVGGVILMLILFPIVFGCKINGLTFEAFCNFFSILGEECIGMIKYYIILLFAFCSFNTLRLMNNFHYYPTYKGLSDVFGHFFSWVIYICMGLDTSTYVISDYVFKIIAYLILMIGTLFYLEIIQLNICGLSINTRKEIIDRIDNDIKDNFVNLSSVGINEDNDDINEEQ